METKRTHLGIEYIRTGGDNPKEGDWVGWMAADGQTGMEILRSKFNTTEWALDEAWELLVRKYQAIPSAENII